MARLGGYEYPEITLSEAVEVSRKISREFGGSISRSSLAEVLEMSERGGRFAAVVGGMRLWGVVQGRGTLRVTREGLRLASPVGPDEAAELRRRFARGVVLFDEIAGRVGDGNLETATLTLLLEEITGAERSEIESRRPSLEKALNDALPYLRVSGLPSARIAEPTASLSDSEARPAYGDRAEERAAGRIRLSYGGGTVDLDEDLTSIGAVIALLEARRRELGG